MVTIRDVAARAKVSVGTVSRVLNQHPAVRPPVRDAVLAAIAELGYQPNSIARSLRAARTRTIGLMVNDLRNPITVAFLREVEDAAEGAGYTVLVAESRSDVETERLHLQAMLDRRVDGLLCSPVRSVREVQQLAQAAGVPLVLVHQRAPHASVPTAFVDEQAAMTAALDHLVNLGHRRIAMLHVGTQAASGPRRMLVQDYLEKRGLATPGADELHRSFGSPEECVAAVVDVMALPNPPTAMFVGAHDFVADALIALRQLGRRVPDDISIVGFGDSRWAEAMSPSISVINASQRQHAITAVDLMTRIIAGDADVPQSVGCASEFYARESCGAVGMGGAK